MFLFTIDSAVGASLVSGRGEAVPAVGDDASLMGPFRLELLHRQRIDSPVLGLDEPSGLTLNADGTALYTVSDDARTIPSCTSRARCWPVSRSL